jgi:hypothetical protein
MSVSRKPVSHEGLHVAPYSGLEANQDGLVPAHPQYSHHSQQYSPYSPHSTPKQEQYTGVPPKNPRKKLFGIPILTFWLLLALIVALVAAVAVVGGVLGSRHTSSSVLAPTVTVSTPPTTVTTTASAVSATGGFSCTQNGTIVTSSTGSTFKTICGQDLGVGVGKDASGNVIWNNTDVDLTAFIVDSYGACIDACAVSIKEGITWSRGIGQCSAVVWVTAGSDKGDCWLKNGTGYPHYDSDIYAAVLEVV